MVSGHVKLEKKQNDQYLGLCPFHKEETPSFCVNDKEKFYYCMGCGLHGDVFDFVEKIKDIENAERLKKLIKIVHPVSMTEDINIDDLRHAVFHLYAYSDLILKYDTDVRDYNAMKPFIEKCYLKGYKDALIRGEK